MSYPLTSDGPPQILASRTLGYRESMQSFCELFQALDETTKTNEKIAAMVNYFGRAKPEDAAWAVYFLSGQRLQRLVPSRLLRQWAAEAAGIPAWLLEESYHVVGDLAETMALVIPPGQPAENLPLAAWVEQRLLPLRSLPEEEQRDRMLTFWRETPTGMRLVVMKLLTGAFRVGVSKRLLARALAQQAGCSADVISHRLMGNWKPTADFYVNLFDPDDRDAQASRPYPFCLANSVDPQQGPATLGNAGDYLAEWKWDGIRGQLIRRQGQTFIWSRGEELMESRWPEIEAAGECLPDGTVLDGEILAATPEGQVLPFAQLQRRIARKQVGLKLLSEVPVVFHAFDLLEHAGNDIRHEPLTVRRQRLTQVLSAVEHPHLRLNELIEATEWSDWARVRTKSRQQRAEGLMLKHKQAAYQVGRVRGVWWKWKVEPYTIDAVLIYAQKGHGKRASLFTDYTFALWKQDQLVPFAKAYSGLDDRQIAEVDRFVRQHTQESFGPVRSVTPKLVMELAFDGLQRSTRHKSGIATRFPRIVRWRHDKRPEDANQLSDLLELLPDDA